MVVGASVIGAMVVGLGLWSAVTKIDNGVSAPGVLRSEGSRKTIRHKEGGTVRQILVKEGQHVKAGQVLLVFDNVQPKASVDVFQNQYDSALAQNARFAAEATGRNTIEFPPELLARMSDPRVAQTVHDQEFLFSSRLQSTQGQMSILDQRQQQLNSSIQGLEAQLDALEERRRLTGDQLDGYKQLEAKGFASKNLVRQYEATMADIAGRKGALLSEIAKTRQQIGEARLQRGNLLNERQSQAAEGMRAMQAQLADSGPKLAATSQTLSGTTVRSPVDGYVLNLSQYTIGGVAAPGEVLMELVPANEPLVVSAQVQPQDIDAVHVGMKARVRMDALSQRWNSPLEATVMAVSADRISDQKTGAGYYRADLRIDPTELKKVPKGVTLTAGMPASTMLVTGKRSVLGYLIAPFKDTLEDAFREQ
jgi:HlyD family type I secretion membrane fusion protein